MNKTEKSDKHVNVERGKFCREPSLHKELPTNIVCWEKTDLPLSGKSLLIDYQMQNGQP